jgi:hypothetical protein
MERLRGSAQRSRLRGDHKDSDVVQINTMRHSYTNLGPGYYRFRVIACNNDGVWNESGATLMFVIAPSFYQTIWFQLLYGAPAAGVPWLLYLVRIKQVSIQIQEPLDARMEERERIARELHDTLLQGFQGLMLRFQAVLKSLPAHEPTRER